jgi:uncharacterized SAM-binding protein YcdF (DUF218 family)
VFLISKLFTSLTLSPLLFILLGLCGLVLYKNQKLAFRFFLAVTLLLYILSIEPTQQLLLSPLENRYPINTKKIARGEVLLVLGAGTIERHQDQTPFESLGDASLKRCVAAAYWYKQKPRPIIVCGGKPAKDAIQTEAGSMAKALMALGLPQKHIYLESFSRNTYENINNAHHMIRAKHWERPILITSATHMPRARHEARKSGLEIIPAACDFKLSKPFKLTWNSLLPNTAKLEDNFSALKEYIGLVYYQLRY